jgi:hypothetical protein
MAAQITRDMWSRSFGHLVDGVVSVDPVFLAYVLSASDPIVLSSGETVSGDNLVSVLLNEVYQRFNTGDNAADNAAQDGVYGEVVSATFAKLMGGGFRPPQLLSAIMQGWSEGRLLIWSAHEEEEAGLVALGLPGEMPVSDSTTDRVGVYVQDNVGSKLGFYLRQTLDLAQATCRTDGRSTYRVTFGITHDIDPAAVDGLSPSIVGQWAALGVPRGTQRLNIMLYAPPGSQITGVVVNGQPVGASGNFDTGYPVDLHNIQIPPGQTVTLSYDVVPAEAGVRVLEAKVTPLVNPTTVTTSVLDCATVAAG